MYYDRIDLIEGTDAIKSYISTECMIFHHWLFNHGFKFEDSVCNGCHDLTMLTLNVSDIAIITVKGVEYCCIIHDINQSEAINLFKKLSAL